VESWIKLLEEYLNGVEACREEGKDGAVGEIYTAGGMGVTAYMNAY